ncbi:MAG: hypothetical protein V3U48_08630 [Rhodospirillales bacterium]
MAPVAGVLQAGFLTGPGWGQVEARLALFVLAASAALIRGRDGKNLAPAAPCPLSVK